MGHYEEEEAVTRENVFRGALETSVVHAKCGAEPSPHRPMYQPSKTQMMDELVLNNG